MRDGGGREEVVPAARERRRESFNRAGFIVAVRVQAYVSQMFGELERREAASLLASGRARSLRESAFSVRASIVVAPTRSR